MEIKNRQGVLGLDTAKQVMIAFLVMVVVAIAVILALTSLQSATTTSVDTSTITGTETNETTGGINQTGFYVSLATPTNSSNSAFELIAVWDVNGTGVTKLQTTNATLNSTGFLQNSTTTTLGANATVSYGYTYTYDNGRTSSIVGNVSGGLVTFFASTGTIFSILIVVVIILAISIIIWAVGRFGNQANESVNL